MKEQTRQQRIVVIGLLIVGTLSIIAMGIGGPTQGENDVYVSYEVIQRLAFSAICCSEVSMTVDVVLQPTDVATATFQVKTKCCSLCDNRNVRGFRDRGYGL